jgi:hypothetical protein
VYTRLPNDALLKTATVVEYTRNPMKKLGTPPPAITPESTVDMSPRSRVGAHSIQCLDPKDTDRPIRMWINVSADTTKRQVCLIVKANHNLAEDAASRASPYAAGPP